MVDGRDHIQRAYLSVYVDSQHGRVGVDESLQWFINTSDLCKYYSASKARGSCTLVHPLIVV